MQVAFARVQPARNCVVLPAYDAERTPAATLQRLPHDAIETTIPVDDPFGDSAATNLDDTGSPRWHPNPA